MKFIFFVEGYTEKKALPSFLKRWLDDRVTPPVGIQPVRFEGWAEYTRDVRKKAHSYLNSPQKDDIIGVIGLIDLYGPTFYPDHLVTAHARYEWGRNWFEKKVNHPKFRQFFAVHETEAWLLSQPELFTPQVRKALPTRVTQPETVNFDEPPAKLLERVFRQHLRRSYKKVVDGKQLFDRLNPETAYAKCSHLKEVLDELLTLATESPNKTSTQT